MNNIAENLNRLQQTKEDIKQAIISRGGSIDNEPFSQYSDAILNLPTGGGGESELDFTKLGYSYAPEFLVDGVQASEQYKNDFNGTNFSPNGNVLFMPKVEVASSGVTVNNTLLSKDYSQKTFGYDNFPNVLIFPDIDFKGQDVSGYNLFYGSPAHSVHLKNMNFIGSCQGMFYNCKSLYDVTFKGCTASGVTSTKNMFYGSAVTNKIADELARLDLSTVTDCYGMFQNCWDYLELDLSKINIARPTDITYMFSTNSNLKKLTLPNWDWSGITSSSKYNYFLGSNYNLQKVIGDIDCTTFGYGMPQLGGSSTTALSKLDTITFINLGAYETTTTLYLTMYYSGWGTGDEESQQSFIRSMENLYDRKAAKYSSCSLNMGSAQKALLSEDLITQIKAKGYTL